MRAEVEVNAGFTPLSGKNSRKADVYYTLNMASNFNKIE